MTLRELLRDVEPIANVPEIQVEGLDYDSRRIAAGSVFFAFPGENVDGHQFIPAARAAGAVAVVSERPQPPDDPGPWVHVPHGRRALALAASRFYGAPDERLTLVGVTGTNGKTTTVYLCDSIFREAGFTTARLGTIDHVIAGQAAAAVNTTPESLDLLRYLVRLEGAGGSHASLEVSSHGLELGRVFGLRFDTAVFTNLSQDHLDYHGDMAAYERAKRRLFEGAGAEPPRCAVLNSDDPVSRRFADAGARQIVSYSRTGPADVSAKRVKASFEGLQLVAATPAGRLELSSRLGGYFNVSNILAAVAVAIGLGLSADVIQRGIERLEAVPGRFETIREGQPFLVAVDYAHTDDALRNLIESARQLLPAGGRVLTVFGCGGDRDRTKRPPMGEVAGRLSDRVILTSDNPRSEDPLRIIADAEVGLQRVEADYKREPDRRTAIRKAFSEARAGDIVLIAGKGHEATQKIGSRTLPFDDREVARELLREAKRGGFSA